MFVDVQSVLRRLYYEPLLKVCVLGPVSERSQVSICLNKFNQYLVESYHSSNLHLCVLESIKRVPYPVAAQ